MLAGTSSHPLLPLDSKKLKILIAYDIPVGTFDQSSLILMQIRKTKLRATVQEDNKNSCKMKRDNFFVIPVHLGFAKFVNFNAKWT
jgi:hypothetical protein